MDITIYRNQLKYEVDIETRKAALFQISQENQEATNEAQLSVEASDKAYFERKCQEGLGLLLDILRKFVTAYNDEEVLAEDADSQLVDDSTWVITLEFDSRRNVVASALAALCHRFLSRYFLYSWAVMTMPHLAEEYKSQLDKTTLDIKRMVYRKENPVLEDNV